MLNIIKRSAMAVAALGAIGLGGSAIAGAADQTAGSGTATQSRPDRPQRAALSSDVAARVKAAALAKVPGATVLRTEAGGPYSSPYHAHVKTDGGDARVVLVDASFEATAVQAEQARGGRIRGDRGGPRGGRGETALTGQTKQKVEAAVKAKYAGATIVRTETNAGSSAPYESHIRTSDGKELEVLVNKDFEVVGADERPAGR